MAALPRGANVDLLRENPALIGVVIGIGWATDPDPAIEENLTVAAILCGQDGQALSRKHVVFFNQPVSADGSTSLVPSRSDHDKQQIEIDLGACPPDVARVVLVLYLN